ncbi:uncharacterized protein SOCE26_054450 [Sorangium cellulosum]|uniref:Uncharacterized protein n=1 Tax=Sorangium cellulosum TaxID=56 RepID=A0A2L0EXG6_SORCE|nr:uncharacterized protein SOCE26_054450 [Sorangium cellulosum]
MRGRGVPGALGGRGGGRAGGARAGRRARLRGGGAVGAGLPGAAAPGVLAARAVRGALGANEACEAPLGAQRRGGAAARSRVRRGDRRAGPRPEHGARRAGAARAGAARGGALVAGARRAGAGRVCGGDGLERPTDRDRLTRDRLKGDVGGAHRQQHVPRGPAHRGRGVEVPSAGARSGVLFSGPWDMRVSSVRVPAGFKLTLYSELFPISTIPPARGPPATRFRPAPLPIKPSRNQG